MMEWSSDILNVEKDTLYLVAAFETKYDTKQKYLYYFVGYPYFVYDDPDYDKEPIGVDFYGIDNMSKFNNTYRIAKIEEPILF